MIERLQRKYALSEQGAKDLVKGCLACAAQNISFLLPVGLLYYLVCQLLEGKAATASLSLYLLGCAGCVGLILFTTWLQYNATYFATYRESGVRRIALAEQLRKIPLSFFGKRDLADLTSSIMTDCAFLETAFSHFIPELAGAILSSTLIALGVFRFDWQMALAALWVLPFSFLIVGKSARVQEAFHKRSMVAQMACADGIQEYLETVRDLKSCNAESAYLAGLFRKIDAVEQRTIQGELVLAVFVRLAAMLLKLGIATVALVGSLRLAQGSLDVPTFFLFLLFVSRFYDPLQGALENLAAIIAAQTNINRMKEILYCPVQTGSSQLDNHGYDIVFDDVYFAYDAGAPQKAGGTEPNAVLNGVSFTARQGEVTALIGPSGSGKTTISRLAARFWDIDRGRITVGGMDIATIDPETLMGLYSIVFQDVILFNGTILENIRIGRRGASDAEVIAAAKLAHVDEFADKLPDKWQAWIGENGCRLSGGERQRISLARAFLKDAPIILLDEATASLDVANETLIQSALSRLIQHKTVLVIAHRMRTVAGADTIVVLADGRVVETGTPAALAAQQGIYAHMVQLQTQGQSWSLTNAVPADG